MPTETKKFSKSWLLTLADSPPEKLTEYRDSDYKFLRARVTPSGNVSLSVRKSPRGYQNALRRSIDIRVDDHMPPMSEIRSMAAAVVREIDSGKARGKTVSLNQAFKEMLQHSTLKPRTIAGYTRNVEKHLKSWLDKPLTGDADGIVRMHRKVGKASGEIAANNTMRTYRRVLKYAGAKGYDAPPWPTENLRRMSLWADESPRKGRLKRGDLPEYWAALDDLPEMWSDLVRFWLLTGSRRREATGLLPSQVNLRRKTVTFTDTKNRGDHTLPLTPTLVEILQRRKEAGDGGPLFPCSEPKNITKHLERATGVHATPHDYRRTFAGLAEQAGVGSHTVSVLLNHRSSAGVTGGYIGELDEESLTEALQTVENKLLELAKAEG